MEGFGCVEVVLGPEVVVLGLVVDVGGPLVVVAGELPTRIWLGSIV